MSHLNPVVRKTPRKKIKAKTRLGTRTFYNKLLQLRLTDTMTARLDALEGMPNRNAAIRRCIVLGLEILESENRHVDPDVL